MDTYQQEIEYFAHCVVNREESYAVDKSGLEAPRLVLAGYKSEGTKTVTHRSKHEEIMILTAVVSALGIDCLFYLHLAI